MINIGSKPKKKSVPFSARYDIVSISGEHESGEGFVIWGWALWDKHNAELLPRMYRSFSEAVSLGLDRLDPYREEKP